MIEADVADAQITLASLSDELVDHICCEVENEMNNGKSFDEALVLIKQKAGIKTLQKIQEDALYLIDQNYRFMKTIMKIAGGVSLALLGLGTVFKIFHWPGASAGLIAGFFLLCFFFFPSAVYVNYKEGKKKNTLLMNLSILGGGMLLMLGVLFKVLHWPYASILLLIGFSIITAIFLPVLLFVKVKEATSFKEKAIYILGVFALLIFELSTLFKILHWPGAAALILVGSVLLVSVFLPLYTYAQFKKTGNISGQFIFLIILSMYAVVLNSLLALNVSSGIVDRFVQDESNSIAIANYLEAKKAQLIDPTNAVADSVLLNSSPERKEISKQADEIESIIYGIQIRLIQNTIKGDEKSVKSFINNPYRVETKENFASVNKYWSTSEAINSLFELEKELDIFREKAVQLTTEQPQLNKGIAMLLTTDRVQQGDQNIPWVETVMGNGIVGDALSQLNYIKRNVRQVESDILFQATSN